MKKVLFLLLILGSFQVKAQNNVEPKYSKWGIGIHAGGCLMPDFEEQLQKNYKLGLNAGLRGSYQLNRHISFKTEVNFSPKGKSYRFEEKQSLFKSFSQIIGAIVDTSIIGTIQGFVDDGIYSTYQGYHKLGYLEVPLIAEASIGKFKIATGPYASVLIKSYTKESLDQNIPLLDLISPAIDSLGFVAFLVEGLIDASFPGYKETFITESTNSDNFTKWNYGFLVQIGYQIHQNTFLEVVYNRGLNSYLVDNNKSIMLSTFTLRLSYNFRLKKHKEIVSLGS